ncbi:hypothetical protein KDE12_08725 [Campylobacter sp. faydin G-105]|uniref:hypothetical protein n=1 Tax=Campylobacter anatolicus TaxID=2829105 RepID=UPI001B9F09C5|nr:hypothetical protein [Campylobacter anatolicus]MBR8462918.1 hypothetical protein [Campylobacter anatolicus]
MISGSNSISFFKLPNIDIARVNKNYSLKETIKVGDEIMTSVEYLNRQAQIEHRTKDFLRAQSSSIISKLRVNNIMNINYKIKMAHSKKLIQTTYSIETMA